MAGKNINYFLMDSIPSGRIKCTIANWTGVAYRIPRTELEKCKERDDLKQSGGYFLFGEDEDTGNIVVYVGQAGVRKNGEGILYRLQEHRRNTDKDYWTEAVVFTTSNNSFGPTEISWLENSFRNLALKANRYIVKNANDPKDRHVFIDEMGMDTFLHREYAYVKRGTRVIGRIPGKKHRRTGIVTARIDKEIISPLQYNGSMDSVLFEHWFEYRLIPNLPSSSTISMGNRDRKKSAARRAVFAKGKNHELLFIGKVGLFRLRRSMVTR